MFNQKKCTRCGLVKETKFFSVRIGVKSGLASMCLVCKSVANRKYKSVNRDFVLEANKAYQRRRRETETTDEKRLRSLVYWKWQLKQYGLTVDEFEKMSSSQGGVCFICLKSQTVGRRLAVDHDHITKKVRGLLCNNCNVGLGYFKDDPELLRLAAAYLLKHTPVVEV
jgi:hypothetical protein